MGYTFLEFMKRIGIFLVCAQSIMHFTAGKSYEKYIKLLIGIMVLGQFIIPVRTLFVGPENAEIWDSVERFQKEMENVAGEQEIAYGDKGMAEACEAEIKDRLESIAVKYNYSIKKIQISEAPPGILITAVPADSEKSRIKVDKIVIATDGGEAGKENGGKQHEAESGKQAPAGMREECAVSLGTGEAYIEITVE